MERATGECVFELIPPDPADTGRGLSALPEPSPWDLFFDIEADPWATDGRPRIPARRSSRRSTGAAVHRYLGDLAGRRRRRRSSGSSAGHRAARRPPGDARLPLRRLRIGRHQAPDAAARDLRQDEVDRLLRGDVLVDLLNVVRQGVRASLESYSLKQIEKFYMPTREGPVTEAGFSVVAFETLAQGRRPDDPRRDRGVQPGRLRLDAGSSANGSRIAERRPSRAGPSSTGRDRSLGDGLPSAAQSARMARGAGPRRGSDGRPPGRPSASEPRRSRRRWLLAGLLDWHRREEKSQWWRWHDLRDESDSTTWSSRATAIAGLEFVGDFERRRRAWSSALPIPAAGPQASTPGTRSIDPNPRHGDSGDDAGQIVALDDVAGDHRSPAGAESEWPAPGGADPGQAVPGTGRCQSAAAGRRRGHRRTASTAMDPIAPSGTCSCSRPPRDRRDLREGRCRAW